jgi:membrane fusion protein (multidrug efflux system)
VVGDKWLVTSGLQPGDKLIVEGLGKLRQPGAKVRAVPAGSPPAPPPGGPGGAPQH